MIFSRAKTLILGLLVVASSRHMAMADTISKAEEAYGALKSAIEEEYTTKSAAVVAARDIPQGHLITKQDIASCTKDRILLSFDAVNKPSSVIGRKAALPLPKGLFINRSDLVPLLPDRENLKNLVEKQKSESAILLKKSNARMPEATSVDKLMWWLSSLKGGKSAESYERDYNMCRKMHGDMAAKFLEVRSVPLAAKDLKKGETIGENSIEMVTVLTNRAPLRYITDKNKLLNQRVLDTVWQGQAFNEVNISGFDSGD